ncbi:hypothetical protein EMPS_08350 [Entomortierella parvispora]|uniref:Uncharacterized protein n=1 Tax=Entomortierella parvispora TaxID=205924 RepID=A0A9P3HGQ5_9FUNG|nr:hypothetical protein EMPS_08350 [Entomortierella parvispora]
MHYTALDGESSQAQNDKLNQKGHNDPAIVATPGSSTIEQPPLLTDLPTECLQLVVSHFEGDLSGLHSLLRVNRLFFRLAVPLLYRSPFQMVREYDGDKLPWDKYKRQVKLLWVLLCSVIHHPWVTEELPPFSTDFPTLYAPGYGAQTKTAAGGSKRKELTTDYLQFYIHQDHASISDAFPSLFPSLICYQMEQWTSSSDMHRIRACIEKAFLMHHPERIQSLSIPVTRVGSIFLEAVGRLRRLRRVEFYDIKFDFDPKDAIEFLRRHQEPYKLAVGDGKDTMTPSSEIPTSTTELTEIRIGGTGDSGVIGKMDLYKILQSMHRPVVIDLTGWRGAVMDISQIPVQSLRSLFLRLDPPLPVNSPVQKLLESARHLRELQLCIAPNHGDLFRWAVEKRRASLEAIHQKDPFLPISKEPKMRPSQIIQDVPQAQRIGSIGSTDFVVEDQRLPPSTGLEVLSLAGETQAVVWALMGATEAYPETLQTLKASSWKRVVNLDLEEDELHHHQDAPAVIPGLAHAGVDPYQQVFTPAELPSSQFLPQIPHQQDQPPLDIPANGSQNDEGVVHGDIPRLCFTPIMTRLVHLELKGEIAALAFDFRSLSHCPQLLVLVLNTRPCGIEPDVSSLNLLLDHAPQSLRQLELMGPWVVTDSEMTHMSQPTALPNLRRLRMVHCRTFLPVEERGQSRKELCPTQRLTTRGLFGAIKQMTQLRELELGLDMGQQQRRHRSQVPARLRFDQTSPEEIQSRGKTTEERNHLDNDDKEPEEEGDIEWSLFPRLLKGLSRHRTPPLHFDIQHWSQ